MSGSFLVVGDSICAYGISWSAVVNNRGLGETVVNGGGGGLTSVSSLAGLPAILASCTPTCFVIHVGINDIRTSVSLTSYLNNLSSMIALVKAVGCTEIIIDEIIPIGITETSKATEAMQYSILTFNYAIRSFCITNNYKMSNGLFNYFVLQGSSNRLPDTSKYNADQVHPNDTGSVGCASYISSAGIPLPLPVVSQFPANNEYYTGDTLTLSVSATGATSYQWQKSTDKSSWSNVGTNSSTYNEANIHPELFYQVFISNANGNVQSDFIDITLEGPVTIPTTPTLYADVDGAATNSGSTDKNLPDLTGIAATVSGSVVSLDGSPDLSNIVDSGVYQSSIYLAQATNTNRKIFWITTHDNTAKTVTVHVAPTGVTSSSWSIGGRNSNLQTTCDGLRPGDTMIINTNFTSTTDDTMLTFNNNGAWNNFITIKGRDGSKPKLISYQSNKVISSAKWCIWVENLELNMPGSDWQHVFWLNGMSVTKNVTISHSGGAGIYISAGSYGGIIQGCEIYGCAGTGMICGSNAMYISSNYIHNCTQDGISLAVADFAGVCLEDNIITNCGYSGIDFTNDSTYSFFRTIRGNVIYHCDRNGILITGGQQGILFQNNILLDNGASATYYNLNITVTPNNVFGDHNCLNQDSARGGLNYLNYVISSDDIVTNPLFVNPSIADFRLQSTSPCKATGFPGIIGSLAVAGYMDMGALQRQEPTAGLKYITNTERVGF